MTDSSPFITTLHNGRHIDNNAALYQCGFGDYVSYTYENHVLKIELIGLQ